jgi:two-component system, chemotaxis family, chemotaxis protein CheY
MMLVPANDGPIGADPFVLVVDDDPDIRETLEALLSMHGHPVVAAADGAEALERLQEKPRRPCLILLDLMMPGMNGFELHQKLGESATFSAIPIVVITGAGADAEARVTALRTEVLRKPFDLQAVLATVKRHCGAPRPS